MNAHRGSITIVLFINLLRELEFQPPPVTLLGRQLCCKSNEIVYTVKIDVVEFNVHGNMT